MTSFYTVNSADDNCSLCLIPLSNTCETEIQGGIVAHGLNRLHPGHRKCMQELAKVSNLCPICRAPFDKHSLFTWKDRVVMDMKLVIKNITIVMTFSLGFVAIAFIIGILALSAAKSPFFRKVSINSISMLVQVLTMQLGHELIQIGVFGGIVLHAFKKSTLYLK